MAVTGKYAVCTRCRDLTKDRHGCGNDKCGWFFCIRCGVLIERVSGRSMEYPGMKK